VARGPRQQSLENRVLLSHQQGRKRQAPDQHPIFCAVTEKHFQSEQEHDSNQQAEKILNMPSLNIHPPFQPCSQTLVQRMDFIDSATPY
jgi:hypothetical protein